ncbi:uncharacterized protein LOC131023161 [Salvia miltiorrhiza]|uniref:uncharacterized protein LOC131023161 n=1 Tax=Salvia miltiorrhiza TaxID=226208 RepID=UPI0025AC42E4|nr:uncharacterized protein LOC131023161 [Salvia miltiorrhiza]
MASSSANRPVFSPSPTPTPPASPPSSPDPQNPQDPPASPESPPPPPNMPKPIPISRLDVADMNKMAEICKNPAGLRHVVETKMPINFVRCRPSDPGERGSRTQGSSGRGSGDASSRADMSEQPAGSEMDTSRMVSDVAGVITPTRSFPPGRGKSMKVLEMFSPDRQKVGGSGASSHRAEGGLESQIGEAIQCIDDYDTLEKDLKKKKDAHVKRDQEVTVLMECFSKADTDMAALQAKVEQLEVEKASLASELGRAKKEGYENLERFRSRY